jgi:uncharacterized protein YpmB
MKKAREKEGISLSDRLRVEIEASTDVSKLDHRPFGHRINKPIYGVARSLARRKLLVDEEAVK